MPTLIRLQADGSFGWAEDPFTNAGDDQASRRAT